MHVQRIPARRATAFLAVAVALCLLAAGCSWMPTWAQPSNSDFIPATPPEGKAVVYFYRLDGPSDPQTFPELMLDGEKALWGLPPNNYWPCAVEPEPHVLAVRSASGALSQTLTLETVEAGMVYFLRLDQDENGAWTLVQMDYDKAEKELYPLARLLGFGS